MKQIKSSLPTEQLTTNALELTTATLINASQSDFLAIIEQLPVEKRRELIVKLILAADLAEKVEIVGRLPLEEMGELAQAIAQVWQEGD